MTRACAVTTVNTRPRSPKNKATASSSTSPLRTHEGGVVKQHRRGPPSVGGGQKSSSIKNLTKTLTKAECYAQLKALLPHARCEDLSELALIEETIAYITTLEMILGSSNSAQHEQDSSLQCTTKLMKALSV